MKYLSGLDDILDNLNEYSRYIPNIKEVIDTIFDFKNKDSEKFLILELKIVSLIFGLKLVNEDLNEITRYGEIQGRETIR